MTLDERKKVADDIFRECQEVAVKKGKDYAGEEDALDNFKRNAEKLGLTKYQVWAVYAGKHIDSIFNSIKYSPDYPQVESEPMRERVKDVIVYMTILQALMEENE